MVGFRRMILCLRYLKIIEAGMGKFMVGSDGSQTSKKTKSQANVLAKKMKCEYSSLHDFTWMLMDIWSLLWRWVQILYVSFHFYVPLTLHGILGDNIYRRHRVHARRIGFVDIFKYIHMHKYSHEVNCWEIWHHQSIRWTAIVASDTWWIHNPWNAIYPWVIVQLP